MYFSADHKGELGKFTTDGQGQAHVYIKDTHFSLRGGRGNSIYGHIVSVSILHFFKLKNLSMQTDQTWWKTPNTKQFFSRLDSIP